MYIYLTLCYIVQLYTVYQNILVTKSFGNQLRLKLCNYWVFSKDIAYIHVYIIHGFLNLNINHMSIIFI